MKLSGSVEVEIIDSITGEVKQHIKQPNLIPDNTLLELLSWNSIGQYFSSKRISISAQQTTPSPTNSTLTQVLATGSVPSGAVPTWNETVNPPFGQIQNRIDPVGISRDFFTIGITALGSNNQHPANTSTVVYAYVRLDTVCTQGVNDFVNIFYRIQFDNAGGQGLSDRARFNFGRQLFIFVSGNDLFRMTNLYNSPNAIADISTLAVSSLEQLTGNTGVTANWTSGTRINSHFKWKYVYNKTRAEVIGLLLRNLVQGVDDADRAYSMTRFENPQEPFQTGFWHSSTAPGPYFDSNTNGTSGGMILLSGTWTGTTPQMFKITILASGAVGVATYRLSIANIPNGTNGNTFVNRRTNTAMVWTDYGWNGTAWVTGNTTAKLTHADNQDLLFGIRVRFVNAPTTPHFTATDFFTQGICMGLLKDNATDIFWQSSWYSRPTQFNARYTAPIPATAPFSLLLPAAADPDFIRIETDQLEYHEFKINNLPVLNVLLDSPPAPQEVSLASSGNGTVLFNASDAGKTFDATYTWIKR